MTSSRHDKPRQSGVRVMCVRVRASLQMDGAGSSSGSCYTSSAEEGCTDDDDELSVRVHDLIPPVTRRAEHEMEWKAKPALVDDGFEVICWGESPPERGRAAPGGGRGDNSHRGMPALLRPIWRAQCAPRSCHRGRGAWHSRFSRCCDGDRGLRPIGSRVCRAGAASRAREGRHHSCALWRCAARALLGGAPRGMCVYVCIVVVMTECSTIMSYPVGSGPL